MGRRRAKDVTRSDVTRLHHAHRSTPYQANRALAVVYGHLHLRGTHLRDGVRFEEVSLGYPRDWNRDLGVGAYLRQILPPPEG